MMGFKVTKFDVKQPGWLNWRCLAHISLLTLGTKVRVAIFLISIYALNEALYFGIYIEWICIAASLLYPTLLKVSIFSFPWLRHLQCFSHFTLTFYILLDCTFLVMASYECKNQKANDSGMMDKLFISVRQTQQMWTGQ